MTTKTPEGAWLAFFLCTISYLFCGTVSTMMSTYLPDVINELEGGSVSETNIGELGAYINAISLYGWMLGGILLGVFGDKFGRKKILIISTILYGVSSILLIVVSNWYLLLFLRFFSGFGVGGVLLLATVYISEIWPEKTRPIMVGILAIAFPVGIVTSGAITVMFSNWRHAFWIALIPLIDAVLMWILLEESEKWKNSSTKGKVDFKAIFQLAYKKNLVLGSLIFGAVLIGLWGLFSWLPTWVQTLLPPGQDGQNERGLTMMLLGMGGIVGGSFSGFIVKSLGNRKSLMLTFGGLILISGLLFLTNNHFTKIVYLEIASLALFFGISQGVLSSYIPQLFPTGIRATATGFCFNVGRLFTATAVFFVGAMVAFFGGFGNALLSFSMFFVIAIAATFFSSDKQPEP
ncbi:MAG: MFS transporter [Bacteroidetes bacterium]|nr:MFS transporter [Bacteroidota bacterium]